jgi:sugar (pentulose or hexulose) kinase
MSTPRHVAVIDIGKTNAKVALVDLETLAETDVRKMPNTVLTSAPYPHYDTDTLWNFILASLHELAPQVDAISITTHGATAALIAADGALALPILDYEFTGPDTLAADYDAVRPHFAETGSPRLPIGLNLGAQLYWQQRTHPEAFARTSHILMYPQYWGYRLSGRLASEATSLGCHTDLWSPGKRDFSSMVDRLGWRSLMPAMRRGSDALGPILPEIAARTVLAPNTPVHVGIHDSNASLLPHLLSRQASFTVLSTGTWVIALAIGNTATELDASRDTLINVNAYGDPVPSARFMGGRENAVLGENLPAPTQAEIDAVLARQIMYLPSAVQGSGPFPHSTGRWTAEPATPGERRAAISFYLALMSATCLDLIGAQGPTIVEGPFAANAEFTKMLEAATARPIVTTGTGTGTSIGAALLTVPMTATPSATGHSLTEVHGAAWVSYADAWRALTGEIS